LKEVNRSTDPHNKQHLSSIRGFKGFFIEAKETVSQGELSLTYLSIDRYGYLTQPSSGTVYLAIFQIRIKY